MNKLLLLGGDNNVEVSLISSIESISIKEGAMLSGWPLPSEKTIIKFILCDLSTDPGYRLNTILFRLSFISALPWVPGDIFFLSILMVRGEAALTRRISAYAALHKEDTLPKYLRTQ